MVDKLIKAKVHKVIINIPNGSVLGSSINNFAILRREAATAGKEIMVESVDEHILELAAVSKIKAINPVFQKRERTVSDIVPRGSLKKKQVEVSVERTIKEEIPPPLKIVEEEKIAEEKKEIRKEKKPRKGVPRWPLAVIILAALGVGGWFLGFRVLP